MKKYLFFAGFTICLLAGCGTQNSYTSFEYVEEKPVEETSPVSEEQDICVSLLGEVVTPGVYILPSGSRVYEVINMAGGLTEEADSNAINLAMVLSDEMQIVVPPLSEKLDPVSADASDSVIVDGKVNINTASVADLMTLSGIGEVRAKAIVDYREKNGKFNSPEEIMKVSGIKESSYDKIKDEIFVK